MDGKYSKRNFFKKYSAIYRTWFQGSESTTPQEVENLFTDVEKKQKIPITMIIIEGNLQFI